MSIEPIRYIVTNLLLAVVQNRLANTLADLIDIPIPNGLALPHIVDGRAGDGFLTIAREVPSNTKTTGADGEVIKTKSRNASGSLQRRATEGTLHLDAHAGHGRSEGMQPSI